MKLSDFDYNLPKELIAQYPLKERDKARLLVLHRKKGIIEHRIFKDISEYFNKGDLMVINDTRVLPSRIKGQRLTGGKVEVLLLNPKQDSAFNALIRPARLKLGEKIIFNGGKIWATLSAKNEVTFNTEDLGSVYKLGVMPIPPYIKREPQDIDNVYYQTVYATREGAVASPTAGLHFTEDLIVKIKSLGVNIVPLTLHIGIGTFKPVRVSDITKHKMEPEYFSIPPESSRLIDDARLNKKRIFAVGTTSLRALETYAEGTRGGCTGLFIYPGYKFKITDGLITNFHLPCTTLFMLACTFGGTGFIKKAYDEAINKKYRFYSYGDAMLII